MTKPTRASTKGVKHRTGCAVEDCTSKHFGRGYCQTHLYRLRMNGDPLVTRKPGPVAGETHPAWRGDDVAYAAVHRRLAVQRGPARQFDCIKCGREAQSWAYQHSAEDERICDVAGLPFTTDLAHYEPMCAPCHSSLDALLGWATPAYGRGTSYVQRLGQWRAYAVLKRKQYYGGLHATQAEADAAARALRQRLLDQHVS